MQRHDIERQSVSFGYEGAHFDVFGATVAFVGIESYSYVKQMHVDALFFKSVNRDGTVHTTRN